jgi:hypothetical protein
MFLLYITIYNRGRVEDIRICFAGLALVLVLDNVDVKIENDYLLSSY